MKSKNRFWSFVRLVYETRHTQQKHHNCQNGLDKRTFLKKSLALEKKLDTEIAEIFNAFPDEAPDNFKIEAEKNNSITDWLRQ